jgi:hypothetical protein
VEVFSLSCSLDLFRFALSDSSEHWSSTISIFSINCLNPTGGAISVSASFSLFPLYPTPGVGSVYVGALPVRKRANGRSGRPFPTRSMRL